jgi:hypothetical protein
VKFSTSDPCSARAVDSKPANETSTLGNLATEDRGLSRPGGTWTKDAISRSITVGAGVATPELEPALEAHVSWRPKSMLEIVQVTGTEPQTRSSWRTAYILLSSAAS